MVVVSFMLVAPACAATGSEASRSTTATAPAESTTTTAPDIPSTTTTATTTTDATPSTTASTAVATTFADTTTTEWSPVTSSTLPEGGLPGTIDALWYGRGATLDVVGVRYDDVLNVRRTPGVDGAVIATLAPDATGLRSTGRQVSFDTTEDEWPRPIWNELVLDDGTVGWVDRAFVAIPSGAFPTGGASLLERVDGLVAPDGESLALLVAANITDTFLEWTSRVEVSGAPEVIDGVGTVSVDVIDVPDDAEKGSRIVISAAVTDTGWTLVGLTDLRYCSRGGGNGSCL